ncbi:MAG: response regulator transcription factor [Candidatus Aegiribacteria sp.]|nr:response regulator transcription factor [Candidatus Aegiribacteria sp.]
MSNDADEWLIYILGPRKMQNELLAAFLEKETGITCRTESTDEFSWQAVDEQGKIMVFCDCLAKKYLEMLELVSSANFHKHSNLYPVLYNVVEEISIGAELLCLEVWGLFFDGEPPENLVRGIEAIQKGEIWLPRQLLSFCLISLRRRENLTEPEQALLSMREREVLQMITTGCTNDKIADNLCISPHTVRSHIYRIFRKIEVSNRQQAAVWAAKNI